MTEILPWHEMAYITMLANWTQLAPGSADRYYSVRYIETLGFCKYNEGVFDPIPEELVPNLIFEEIFRSTFVTDKKGKTSTVPETAQNLHVFKIKAQGWLYTPLAECDPYPLLAIANGILDISDPTHPTLHEFSPKYVSIRKLPVKLLGERVLPAGGAIFDACSEGELPFEIQRQETPKRNEMYKTYPTQVPALETWVQGVILRDPRNAIIPFIVGPKNSGKGTWLQIIERIFGPTAGHEAISQLGDPRYGLYPLITKWVNIDREMTHKFRLDPEGMRVMKDVITHEGPMTVKKLYRDAFETVLWLWFLAATNQLPSLPENADRAAWFKRVMVVVFDQVMPSDETFKQAVADEADKIFTNLILGLADYEPLRPDGADVDKWATEQEDLWEYWSSPAIQACLALFAGGDEGDTIRVQYATAKVGEWLDEHQFSPPKDSRLTADVTRALRSLHGGKECVKGRSGKPDRIYFNFRVKDEGDYAEWCEQNPLPPPKQADAKTAKAAGPRQKTLTEDA